MEQVFDLMPLWGFAAGFAVALVAGFVKGAVGFAMPLLTLSGLSLYLEPALAIAGLVVPTLVSNLIQALRFGLRAVWGVIVEYRLYLTIVCTMILIVSQFVTAFALDTYFLILGLLVAGLALVQLMGVRFTIPPHRRRMGDILVGLFSGTLGGFSGTWGPPTVMYLLALDVPRTTSMLVQGVIYGIGSFMLVAGHVNSGVITGASFLFSCYLVIPALIGQWIGGRMGDRLNPETFRRITLIVILLAGANMIRRGIF